MHCLKCGKETTDGRVFCDGCLEVMEAYPVKMDASVQLPHRPAAELQKKRALQPEEQLAMMHKLIRRLIAALVLVSVLFLFSAAGLAYLYKNSNGLPAIGRNYTIDVD